MKEKKRGRPKSKEKKINVNVRISPIKNDAIKTLVPKLGFSSKSHLINRAVDEFIVNNCE